MNLNLRDPIDNSRKKQEEMKKSIEVQNAKISIERLKWEKMDSESVSILLGIKYTGLALAMIVASLCLCEMGSNFAKAINPITAEEALKKIEDRIDKKLGTIPVIKDSATAEKK